MTTTERIAIAILALIGLLLFLGITRQARADGMPVQPLPPPAYYSPGPRHIYRDGNYFFCPYPEFDPYCQMPNDYSWALYGRPADAPPPRQDFGQESEKARIIQEGISFCRRFPYDPICPK